VVLILVNVIERAAGASVDLGDVKLQLSSRARLGVNERI
jgi:hypothetical protein